MYAGKKPRDTTKWTYPTFEIAFLIDVLSNIEGSSGLTAITCIVAIPSVIGALLGMNLLGMPWPWPLWQVALFGISPAVLMAAYFYMKGWLGGSKGLYLERP